MSVSDSRVFGMQIAKPTFIFSTLAKCKMKKIVIIGLLRRIVVGIMDRSVDMYRDLVDRVAGLP